MKAPLHIIVFISLFSITNQIACMDAAALITGITSLLTGTIGSIGYGNLNSSPYRAYEHITDQEIKNQKKIIKARCLYQAQILLPEISNAHEQVDYDEFLISIAKIKEMNFEPGTQRHRIKKSTLSLFEKYMGYESRAREIQSNLQSDRSFAKGMLITSGISFASTVLLLGAYIAI